MRSIANEELRHWVDDGLAECGFGAYVERAQDDSGFSSGSGRLEWYRTSGSWKLLGSSPGYSLWSTQKNVGASKAAEADW
jgi:hypothetical protein